VNNKEVAGRFRGFLPVVVDVETAGFNSETDALLEIAAVFLDLDEVKGWYPFHTVSCHITPFEGANLEQSALEFNKIDPFHPFRIAVEEKEGLSELFEYTNGQLDLHECTRAILVGHNPSFDLSFIKAAAARTRMKKSPFHNFSTFDTAALAGLAYGQTVLSRAVIASGSEWDNASAHSAVYDAERTADLFCKIVNLWDRRSEL
jgi:ribonuclease T